MTAAEAFNEGRKLLIECVGQWRKEFPQDIVGRALANAGLAELNYCQAAGEVNYNWQLALRLCSKSLRQYQESIKLMEDAKCANSFEHIEMMKDLGKVYSFHGHFVDTNSSRQSAREWLQRAMESLRKLQGEDTVWYENARELYR
mmetsp:Transcript_8530/g.12766  ORF Transcript_8530/g.12766 Transcript_8530/m.12766 type:complete len:145 (+) Transcript_8530:2-436(+)